jgi:phosphoglycolate phosphatase
VRPIELIVFDLDGTLVDSRRDLAESANAVLGEFGLGPLAEAAIVRMIGDGAAVLVRRAFDAAGAPEPPDALPRFLRTYNSRLLQFTKAYDGIHDTLEKLAGRPLAVLTNKPRGATLAILEGLDLARFFPEDRVIGGDGPYPRKPAPDGLIALAARTGAQLGATLMVGDSVIDWTTAGRAGARACVAAYGFGFDDFPVARLTADDNLVRAPSEILDCL